MDRQDRYDHTGGIEMDEPPLSEIFEYMLIHTCAIEEGMFYVDHNGIPLTLDLRLTVIANNIAQYGRISCVYCHKTLQLKDVEIEHKHPSSRNGGNTLDNLTVSCRHCNAQKGNRTPNEYMAWKKERYQTKLEDFLK